MVIVVDAPQDQDDMSKFKVSDTIVIGPVTCANDTALPVVSVTANSGYFSRTVA